MIKLFVIATIISLNPAFAIQSFIKSSDASLTYSIQLKNGKYVPFTTVIDEGPTFRVTTGKYGTITDHFETKSNYLVIEREWKLFFPKKTKFRLPMRLTQQIGTVDNWTIPAVVYNDNKFGKGSFPTPTLDNPWAFREDRSSIPSCSIIEFKKGGFLSFFTEPAENEDMISSIQTTSDYLEIMTPWEETPKRYVSKGLLPFTANKPTKENYFKIKGQFNYKRKFYIVAGKEKTSSYIDTFRTAWKEISSTYQNQLYQNADWTKIASAKLRLLEEEHYYQDHEKEIYGLKRGLRKGLGSFIHRVVEFSFLTKSAEGANIFWEAGGEMNNSNLADKAVEMADYLMTFQEENGLFYTGAKYKNGKKGESFYIAENPKHYNTRSMGEAAHQMLILADRIENKYPIKAHTYRNFAKKFAAFFVNKDCRLPVNYEICKGNFGQSIDKEGNVVSYETSNAAYVIWVLAKLYTMTNDQKYLNFALKGARHFYEKIKKREFESDALDASATDKEFGHTLLRSFLMLHPIANEQDREWLLDGAKRSAEYLLTWMFLYDVPYSKELPLGEQNFHTFGGTSVSVAHHHLDVYGAAIAVDFLNYSKISNDPQYIEYARALMGFTSQLVALPENNYLGMTPDLYGWQAEQFNHTTWNYLPYGFEGKRGTFTNPIAWVPVLTLGAMLEIRKDYPWFMDFSIVPVD